MNKSVDAGGKDNAVILFTRVPEAGRTKTRLQPFLGGEACSLLHRAFIKDIYGVIKTLGFEVIVSYSPDGNLNKLKRIIEDDVAFVPQRGDGLGEKMHNAIKDTLEKGYKSCILMGSDIPMIKREDIPDAFRILENKDVVLSPTQDGGYYLIGMKEECSQIFDVEYGNSKVWENTLRAIKNAGRTYGAGNRRFDVDDREDLLKLACALKTDASFRCAETRKALEYILGYEGKNDKCQIG